MRDDEFPDRAEALSEAMEANRVWRETSRKKMIESIELLLAQAQKLALSQYTRSAERSKWTRLAGQLIRWKDEILRATTFEALEHDVHAMMRYVYKQDQEERRPTWQRIGSAPSVPALVKKRVGQDDEDYSADTVPEMMREDVPDNASSDTEPFVPPVVKKKEDREDVTTSDSGSSSENPVA